MFKDEYIDEDLENELNNISRICGSIKIRKNNYNENTDKNFYMNDLLDDIDFEEYDKLFLEKDKNNKKNNHKFKKNDEETLKFYREYEKRIEMEIENEMKETFDPLEHIPGSDKERSNILIKNSPYVRKALENNIVTYEEIVFFIDYWELISLLNSKKCNAVDTLQKISDLFVEDDTWSNLQKQLEQTVNQTNLILDTKLDLRSLYEKYEKNSSDITNQQNEEIYKLNNSEYKTSHNTSSISNTISNKLKNKTISDFNNTKSKDPYKNLFATKNININSNRLKESISSKSSLKTENSNKIDLFNNSNSSKITNLVKFRNDRKEMIKANKGQNINSRPDLFKFAFPKNLENKMTIDSKDSQDDEMNSKFLELLEMPKLIDKIEPSKKNSIRKKIEDAVNFYKNKFY